MKTTDYQRQIALDDLAEILSGNEAFEADCVAIDKKATERERALAHVIHACYKIVHPLTSDCCGKKS